MTPEAITFASILAVWTALVGVVGIVIGWRCRAGLPPLPTPREVAQAVLPKKPKEPDDKEKPSVKPQVKI